MDEIRTRQGDDWVKLLCCCCDRPFAKVDLVRQRIVFTSLHGSDLHYNSLTLENIKGLVLLIEHCAKLNAA